jgi:hypothetical protein
MDMYSISQFGGVILMDELRVLYSLGLEQRQKLRRARCSLCIFTVLFLPREPIYPGTRKQYSVEKVLSVSLLTPGRKSGNGKTGLRQDLSINPTNVS